MSSDLSAVARSRIWHACWIASAKCIFEIERLALALARAHLVIAQEQPSSWHVQVEAGHIGTFLRGDQSGDEERGDGVRDCQLTPRVFCIR